MSKKTIKEIQSCEALKDLQETIADLVQDNTSSEDIEEDLFKLLNAFVCTNDDEMLIRLERSNVLFTYRKIVKLVRTLDKSKKELLLIN